LAGEDNVRQLMASSKCEICGNSYEEDNITVLGHIGQTWILQLFCGSCNSQTLLAAEIDESEFNNSNPVASLTDLQKNEINKFE